MGWDNSNGPGCMVDTDSIKINRPGYNIRMYVLNEFLAADSSSSDFSSFNHISSQNGWFTNFTSSIWFDDFVFRKFIWFWDFLRIFPDLFKFSDFSYSFHMFELMIYCSNMICFTGNWFGYIFHGKKWPLVRLFKNFPDLYAFSFWKICHPVRLLETLEYAIHHYRISILNRSNFPQFQTNLSETLHVGDVCCYLWYPEGFLRLAKEKFDIRNWCIHHIHSSMWTVV